MSSWWKAGVGGIVVVAFAGVFVLSGGMQGVGWGPPKPKITPQPVVKRGNYGQYLYALSDLSSQNKKMAQYDPTLPDDDAVVLAALKALTGDVYGVNIPEDLQPAVETIDETNYVTFTYGRDKFFFELFKNSSGHVGTVRLWREPAYPHTFDGR